MTTVTSESATLAASSPGYQRAMSWIQASPKRLFIGGEWVESRSGKTIETINPETELALTRVAEANEADVDAAVVAARRAFESPTWSGISPHARTRALLRIADLIEGHTDELAALESLDNGMPLWQSTTQVGKAAEVFRYYAGWPSKIFGTTNPTDESIFLYTVREPMGVCGQITAWNMPLIQANLKLATALACGNTVILKPASLTPLSTLRLAELIQESGLPPGVVNIITGPGSRVGAAIAAHPGIDKVSVTGSTEVGKEILRASAGNLKRITLELGGKSPNIIFADADLEAASATAVKTFCSNSGQHCSAGTRLLVHESVHDEVAERISKIAATYKVGSPFAADTRMGPLISRTQLDSVMSYVAAGKSGGAHLQYGGARVGSVGYFIEPAVFSAVSNTMKIAREEIFGPVLSIIPFKDEQDAITKANDTEYGLAAAIWTRDIARGHRVARAIKAGRIWLNTYGDSDSVMPFGGYKQSGYGREQGAESLEAYTQVKSILVRL